MLIEFKSKSAADVPMYKEHAKLILDLLHKNLGRGVITADEAAGAVAALEAAVAESRVHAPSDELKRDVNAHHGDYGFDNEHEQAEQVSFATRVYPLLEMLRAAKKDRCDVMWGV
jgi:hypothetical protein